MTGRLERVVPFALAATILGIAGGSSSVRWVIEHTRGKVRWELLVLLLLLAGACTLRRGVPRVARPPAWPAAAFAGLCVLSSAWSVAPRVTFERAGTLVVAFATAFALALAARGSESAVARVLLGILGGAVAVALASLVTLAFTHSNAVQPATLAYGARFQGFSQNPNTLGMLLALALPIAAWAVLAARTRLERAGAAAVAILLFAELAAAGSRGSLVAALTGLLVLLAFSGFSTRRRLALGAACVLLVAGAAGASRLAHPAATVATGPGSRLPRDAELHLPLETEIGAPRPGAPIARRGLFSSSGRFAAWRGAIRQARERPVAGYGFGTEGRVFVDRYYGLDSDLTENSYVGLSLQLGLAGLGALAALVVSALRRAVAPARASRASAAALAVVAGGLILAVGQSYLFSIGATGALPFWICVFLASALAPRTA